MNRRQVISSMLKGVLTTAAAGGTSSRTTEAVSVSGALSVRSFGAKGDGTTKDTQALQRAIDQAAAQGGGTVIVPPGVYVTGTISLQSNVTLHVEAGATVLGSPDVEDYVLPAEADHILHNPDSRHLIFAFRAESVALTGSGIVDGGSLRFLKSLENKPKPDARELWHVTSGAYWGRKAHVSPMVEFAQCTNVRIEDVTLRNSLGWTLRPIGCTTVLIRGIKIRNPTYSPNADGIDPTSCQNVMISDCDVDTGDDAICIKSNNVYGDNVVTRNVTVTNCILASACNGFKIGSEGPHGIENITFSNSVVYSRAELEDDDRVISGIDIIMPDGGWVEGVSISNIIIRNARVPIFIRLQNRIDQPGAAMTSWMRSILISDVQAFGAIVTSSIMGIPGYRAQDITLRNIRVQTNEFASPEWARNVPPEREHGYAEGTAFGRFPASGFYCRHVQCLSLSDIDVRSSTPDPRPTLVCEDVVDLSISSLTGTPTAQGEEMVRLTDVSRATLRGNRSPATTGRFVLIEGEKSQGISLVGNDFPDLQQAVECARGVPAGAVRVDGKAV